MNYTTHLLPAYISWHEFYEEVKPHIGPYDQDIYWQEYNQPPILIHHVQTVPHSSVSTKKHKYSVRFIEEQVINELAAQVKLQAFNAHDLKELLYCIEYLRQIANGSYSVELYDKIRKLLEIEYKQGRA